VDLAIVGKLRFVPSEVTMLNVLPGVHVALDAISRDHGNLGFGWLAEVVTRIAGDGNDSSLQRKLL
jgi:hypothetical protein